MPNPPPARSTAEHLERALETLRVTLAARGLRMSTTRKAILRATLERQGHFDAAMLADGLRIGSREIPLSTVYRNIPLMVDARIVRPTLFLQGSSQFYEVTFERPPHDHLVCRSCGAVVEFHVEALAALRRDIATMYAFELTSHVHEMTGVCARCRAKDRR